jgi:prepilin-type processing-associated H-X9-DG protein
VSDGWNNVTLLSGSDQFGRHGSGERRDYKRGVNVVFGDFHVERVDFVKIWSGNAADYLAPTGQYAAIWGYR